MRTMTTTGDAETRAGMAAHVLLITASMRNEHFCNADGEMLVVAQENKLRFRTEVGVIGIGEQLQHRGSELERPRLGHRKCCCGPTAVVLAETLPPAVVGVLFLGDTTRHGLTPVAVIGFALAVASAVMLARFGEADHAPDRPAHPEPGQVPRQGLA